MVEKWIVLLNFNLASTCAKHVGTFSAVPEVGVFLVDNASSLSDFSLLRSAVLECHGCVAESPDQPEDEARLARWIAGGGRLVLCRNPINLGFSGGNNTALRLLCPMLGDRGQFLVINPDIVISPESALQLLEHPAEICGPAVYEHYMKAVSKYGHDVDFSTGFGTGHVNEAHKVACISGCCFKVSGVALERYGFLPDENFLYDEEIKYFERVHRLGGTPVYVPEVQVEHIGSLSVRKRSFIYFYYIFRNRLTYFKDIAGPRYGRYGRFTVLYAAWCLGTMYSNLKIRNWDGLKGIIRGVWDGLRGLGGPLVR